MKSLFFSLVTGLLFLIITCEKNDLDLMEIKGKIEQQGITSYQYGTHTITAGDDFYALRSEKINLDDYVGEEITIYAKKVEGYPVDNGPEYLEVEKVKE